MQHHATRQCTGSRTRRPYKTVRPLVHSKQQIKCSFQHMFHSKSEPLALSDASAASHSDQGKHTLHMFLTIASESPFQRAAHSAQSRMFQTAPESQSRKGPLRAQVIHNKTHKPTCRMFTKDPTHVFVPFPQFLWSSRLASSRQSAAVSLRSQVLPLEVSLATIAHWLRNQLMCASRQARCYDRNAVCDGPRLHLPQARPAICRSRQLAAQALADVRRYCRSSSHTASVGWNESAPDCVHSSHVEGTRLRTDATRGTITHVHW